MTGAAGEPLARPRLLLDGDAAARPDGLERALTRAGFHIGEVAPAPHEAPPDALLTTLPDRRPRAPGASARARRRPSRRECSSSRPRTATPRPPPWRSARRTRSPRRSICRSSAPGCMARIRERQSPTGTPHEARVREIPARLRRAGPRRPAAGRGGPGAGAAARPGARLTHCSFVVTRAGEDAGRVIADLSDGRSEHARLDLARYPEIAEAVRSRRTLAMPDMHAGASGDAHA